MRCVRVVKRKEREAANNLGVVADQTPTRPRMTAEMVVKSWITATRERRDGEIRNCLVDSKRDPLVSE